MSGLPQQCSINLCPTDVPAHQRTFHTNQTIQPVAPPDPYFLDFSTNFTIPALSPIEPIPAFLADRSGRLLGVKVAQSNDGLFSASVTVTLLYGSPPFFFLVIPFAPMVSIGPLVLASGTPVNFDFSGSPASAFPADSAVGISITGFGAVPISGSNINISAVALWGFD